MFYTAFFDEANTHGPSPTIIMACFLANAREWVLFSRRLRGLQRRYGFKMFHATDFTNKKGEFKGWDDAKCLKLVEELTELVRDNLTEGDHRPPRTRPIRRGVRCCSRYLGTTPKRGRRHRGQRLFVHDPSAPPAAAIASAFALTPGDLNPHEAK